MSKNLEKIRHICS